MQLPSILKLWVGTLAKMFVAWHEHRRERHALIVACENQHVVLRIGNANYPDLQVGQEVSAEQLRVVRDTFVILEFPANKIVKRDINVPTQAQKFLSGVIRNQIERLSPWPPGKLVYGFNANENREDPSVIDVRILMASRVDIDDSRQCLTALGVEVDRIVANNSNLESVDESSGYVTLWSRLSEASRDRVEKTSRLIGFGICAAAVVSIGLSFWAGISAGSVRDESEGIAARAKILQRQVQDGRMPSTAASMPPLERAWFLKEVSVSSVVLIEGLSRALPDTAYLTEFRVENSTLRMSGLADDAPGLLAPLEKSGHLTGVHFYAPTTRGPDGRLFRFSIEAHVEPHTRIAEK
jgi:general secretion pathway protein L